MTKYTINADALQALATALRGIGDGIEVLQPTLPLCDGADQALEAFMEERDTLKTEIDELDRVADFQAGVIRRRDISIEQANSILRQVADFNTNLQEQLNAIGIRFEAGEEAGTADVYVNLPTLQAALAA